MQSRDLIKYQTYANALVKLNNATNTLLRSGASEEAIKFILQGTNILFEELTCLMKGINNEPFFTELMDELRLTDEERTSTKRPGLKTPSANDETTSA